MGCEVPHRMQFMPVMYKLSDVPLIVIA
uniref:Uncharacterized protein n=1 Tax=Cupriavidus taiwanensis TaxID=164546 RepID=A0A375HA39_9BURK|nr:protein of unknown function [Cupriavidus taiwanensis]